MPVASSTALYRKEFTADQNQQEREQHVHNDGYSKVGPRSEAGVEASDLPDGGRGSVETNFGKDAARNLPHQTGGTIGGEVGMRGHPDAVQSDERGGRKKN
jgi:hypothetical protein